MQARSIALIVLVERNAVLVYVPVHLSLCDLEGIGMSTKVTCLKNGPLLFEGFKVIKNAKGEDVQVRAKAALCRCGESNNKPFCDGTHATVGFIDEKSNERRPDKRDNHIGKEITVNEREFTVVGVMAKWEPMPRFYDLIESGLDDVAEVFVPLSLTPRMEISSAGSDWGWKSEPVKTFDDWLNSESCWLQFWAELETPAEQNAYLAHLDAYVTEQKKLGRFQRPLNNQIQDVTTWLEYNEVVIRDVRVLVGLGFLFLIVCLLSSISLLLTKFEGRASEISLRRALGANRLQIISQNLIEVGFIGVCGGVIGVLLTMLSLNYFKTAISVAPEALFQIDTFMISVAIIIAIFTSLVAGVYPAVKTCAIAPAQHLKTQ